jgi:hypothetical protein
MSGEVEKDIRELTIADLPYLRITPTLGRGQWLDEITHRVEFLFNHEFGVAGVNATDLFDFWGAIEAAWFDQTMGLMVQLRANANALRVNEWSSIGPTGNPTQIGGGLGIAYVGVVKIGMDITTAY